ncbi:hypothetical protein MMC31_000402 [Peltigera leucophlebia]|nr:hypothetical protein [Peltigera leucophlebia]
MVVSFAVASCLATEFGTEFQKQLDQIEAIPPIKLVHTREDLISLKADIAVLEDDVAVMKGGIVCNAALTSTHRLDNARKRILNAGIFSLDTPLHDLVSVHTGEAINGFPPNVAAVNSMTVALIRPIMAAMDNPLPNNPGVDASRKLLHMEIGLSAEPVNVNMPIRI